MTEFGAAFREASRAIGAERGRALRGLGLHAGQVLLLGELWREDGLTPGELAARMGVETPTVTRMAQRMERAGFVQRRPDPADPRLGRRPPTQGGPRPRARGPPALARGD